MIFGMLKFLNKYGLSRDHGVLNNCDSLILRQSETYN